jgi:hypothetical protein
MPVLLLAAVALSVATVPLARGHLSRLGQVRFRHTWAIFGALGTQIVIVSVVPGGDALVHRLLHIGSYALAAVFVYANRRIVGIPIVALGGALNTVAIVANNGVMPASRSALRAAGLATTTDGFMNSAAVEHPRLLLFGDIFAIPKGWPLHSVYSIGDMCIAVGVAVAIHALSASRLIRRSSREETGKRSAA